MHSVRKQQLTWIWNILETTPQTKKKKHPRKEKKHPTKNTNDCEECLGPGLSSEAWFSFGFCMLFLFWGVVGGVCVLFFFLLWSKEEVETKERIEHPCKKTKNMQNRGTGQRRSFRFGKSLNWNVICFGPISWRCAFRLALSGAFSTNRCRYHQSFHVRQIPPAVGESSEVPQSVINQLVINSKAYSNFIKQIASILPFIVDVCSIPLLL